MSRLRACYLITLGVAVVAAAAAAPARGDAPPPQEFLDEAKALLVVGACAEGTVASVKPEVYAAHCKKVRAAQDEYKRSWLADANAFFRENVPATIPRTVVYPFAGGDLATALTVFPEADE